MSVFLHPALPRERERERERERDISIMDLKESWHLQIMFVMDNGVTMSTCDCHKWARDRWWVWCLLALLIFSYHFVSIGQQNAEFYSAWKKTSLNVLCCVCLCVWEREREIITQWDCLTGWALLQKDRSLDMNACWTTCPLKNLQTHKEW